MEGTIRLYVQGNLLQIACQNECMAGFSVHTGKIAVLNSDHVDTDRIIPARFLSMVTKTGYGELLFTDVRGEDFELDQPAAAGASVLVVGANFGCGSSREHAVWAIQQAGYACVIAKKTAELPGFSDIFRQNAANCGLLLIELESADHAKLVSAGSGATVEVDLPAETVKLGSESINFAILPATKAQLIKGLDLVGQTLEFESAIDQYEKADQSFVPQEASIR